MTRTKTCTKCGETKPLSEFSKHRGAKLQPRCKSCNSEWQRQYRKGRYNHDWHLQRTYGITLEDYDAMLETQGGGCAICGMTPEKNRKRLSVDHDHNTGKIRGLLCNGCNRLLGFANDNPETCRRAMLYLRGSE